MLHTTNTLVTDQSASLKDKIRIRELEWQVGRLSEQLNGRFCHLNNRTTANLFLTERDADLAERDADLEKLLELESRRLMGSYARVSGLNRCAAEVYAGIEGAPNKALVKELYLKVDEWQNQLGLGIQKYHGFVEELSVIEACQSMREHWLRGRTKTNTVEGSPAPKRQWRD